MEIDDVSGEIIDAAMRVHLKIRPGLLESVYEMLLTYEGITFAEGLRLDLLVDEAVIIELKSVESLAQVHAKQLLTYLRLLDLKVGLLINFGGATLKEGLSRVVNNYQPATPGASSSGDGAANNEVLPRLPPRLPPPPQLRVTSPPPEPAP